MQDDRDAPRTDPLLGAGSASGTESGPIQAFTNAAKGMAAVLTSARFKVTYVEDVTHVEWQTAVTTFARSLTDQSQVVLYFACHGIALNGHQYLRPTDAKGEGRPTYKATAL